MISSAVSLIVITRFGGNKSCPGSKKVRRGEGNGSVPPPGLGIILIRDDADMI
jgi:hypothetical protein